MSKRNDVPKALDNKIFKTTASRVKKINIDPRIMRGGTRL